MPETGREKRMGINPEIERLYWNTAQKEIIADRGDFGGYYAHLEDIFMTLVKRSQENREIPELSAEYLAAFHNRMKQITMRTLLFEMELSKDCGELAGESPEEQYRFFADSLLKNPGGFLRRSIHCFHLYAFLRGGQEAGISGLSVSAVPGGCGRFVRRQRI